MTTNLLQSAEAVAVELESRLSAIRLANGCETDIGSKIYMGLRKIDDSMIPCTVVIEGDDIPGRGTVGTEYELEQRYVLFAYSPCDPKHPNVAAHKAIRDIKRAVFLTDGKADPRWGRRVVAVRYLGRAIGPRTDGVGFVLSAVEIAVDYVEVLAKPA